VVFEEGWDVSGSGIFFRQGDELVAMTEQPYALEDHLQELLARHPDLLAGGQMNTDSPRRWLLVSREAGLPSEKDGSARWSVDHLFLDQDGVPTLVEVKRSSDSRLRREVVGQLLDYAANAVAYWGVDEVRAIFERQCAAEGRDAAEAVAGFLDAATDPESFWERVATNLKAARLRLVFVADEVPPELQRIVEYLNEQMTETEVLAVEIKQFVGGGLQSLVPRVIGQTQAARGAKGSRPRPAGRTWDKQAVLEDIEAKVGPEAGGVARRIFEWAEPRHLRIAYGRGSVDGSFQPGLDDETGYLFPFVVYTNGAVEITFQRMVQFPQAPFDRPDKRKELQTRLNAIDGVAIADDRLELRPSFPLAALVPDGALTRFLETVEWAFNEARDARSGGFAKPV
jgi:hypothetical protein